nr:hypothetical protein [Nocardia arizonensis]
MFSIAALVPSPPILVPELGGAIARADSADRDDPCAPLRAAVAEAVAALAALARRWIVLGAGTAESALGPEAVGTFHGYGVDVAVSFAEPAAVAEPDPRLPLPALIAGWLRGRYAPGARLEGRILAADADAASCAALGARLRAELDADREPHGVLVVADGASTLTLKAPGYLDERADPQQAELDRALSAGDRAALLALDPDLCADLGISGRPVYQALAGLFEADPLAPAVTTLYRDAPFGVGYHVGIWRPGGAA